MKSRDGERDMGREYVGSRGRADVERERERRKWGRRRKKIKGRGV